MNNVARAILKASVLPVVLALAGCGSFDPTQFDPTAIFESDLFNTKKKLPGERKPVFPEGTPGVSQGVPQELVKGYQAPPEGDAVQQAQSGASQDETKAAAKAEAKPKPKPRMIARPREESAPTSVTVRPQPQTEANAQPQGQSQVQWPDPPPVQQAPAANNAWPGARPSGGVAWPDPPAAR
jgi:hypothetical protein